MEHHGNIPWHNQQQLESTRWINLLLNLQHQLKLEREGTKSHQFMFAHKLVPRPPRHWALAQTAKTLSFHIFRISVCRNHRKSRKRKEQFAGRLHRRIEPDIRSNFCPESDERNRLRPPRTLDSKGNAERKRKTPKFGLSCKSHLLTRVEFGALYCKLFTTSIQFHIVIS